MFVDLKLSTMKTRVELVCPFSVTDFHFIKPGYIEACFVGVNGVLVTKIQGNELWFELSGG